MTHQELPSYDQAPAGAIRFNTDSRKLEVYCGGPVGFGTTTITGAWYQIDSFTPDTATGGTRGVFGGGGYPTTVVTIDYVTISTTGNALDFGDLNDESRFLGACSSNSRGIFAGGYSPSPISGAIDTIEFITIASTGGATDFGDLTRSNWGLAGCSNKTRGVFSGGGPTIIDTIDYITIASAGAAKDFGDLITPTRAPGACSSSTRGVIGGGNTGSLTNTIDFITISTLGNSSDFGDLTSARNRLAACSSSTRGIFAGGTPTYSNTIDYITIHSTGNAVDFGDLTQGRNGHGACSSSTRGVFGGGVAGAAPLLNVDTIDYVTINSTGNAVDFGDLFEGRGEGVSALSNGHGGL
jgi:hypothetical protein